MPKRETPRQKAEAIAQAIATGDHSPEAIIEAVRGCGPYVWHLLDERPRSVWGLRPNQWHPYLRQVRNSHVHGPRLLKAVNA